VWLRVFLRLATTASQVGNGYHVMSHFKKESVMKAICVFLFAITVGFSSSFAIERNREAVSVTGFMPISSTRIVETGSRNTIRVYVNQGAWPGSSCRETAFDIRKEDSHIYSALLAALASGWKISVAVEDSQKPNDDVCQAVSLYAKP
jgi:hypothetical protein